MSAAEIKKNAGVAFEVAFGGKNGSRPFARLAAVLCEEFKRIRDTQRQRMPLQRRSSKPRLPFELVASSGGSGKKRRRVQMELSEAQVVEFQKDLSNAENISRYNWPIPPSSSQQERPTSRAGNGTNTASSVLDPSRLGPSPPPPSAMRQCHPACLFALLGCTLYQPRLWPTLASHCCIACIEQSLLG